VWRLKDDNYLLFFLVASTLVYTFYNFVCQFKCFALSLLCGCPSYDPALVQLFL
jgi:hypothetical protein